MGELRKVRTTMQPDTDIEVDDAEFLDLQRQGLLLGQGDDKAEDPGKAQAKQAMVTERTHGVAPKSAVEEVK